METTLYYQDVKLLLNYKMLLGKMSVCSLFLKKLWAFAAQYNGPLLNQASFIGTRKIHSS